LGYTDNTPDTNLAAGHFIPDADWRLGSNTDPKNPDTDEGGILDGEEDKDHDGWIDRKETDPNDMTDDLDLSGRRVNQCGTAWGLTAQGHSALTSLGLLLLTLGWALARRRRPSEHHGGRRLAYFVLASSQHRSFGNEWEHAQVGSGLMVCVAGAWPLSTLAKENINTQRFRPAVNSRGLAIHESGEIEHHLDFTTGIIFNYAYKPLVLLHPETEEELRVVVSDRVGANIMFAIGLVEYLELGSISR